MHTMQICTQYRNAHNTDMQILRHTDNADVQTMQICRQLAQVVGIAVGRRLGGID